MLAIDGLSMPGLAPPEASMPATAQDTATATDFATLLAAAGQVAPAGAALLLLRAPEPQPELLALDEIIDGVAELISEKLNHQ